MEHYVLTPPDVVERVTPAGRAVLGAPPGCPWGTVTAWTGPGRGRTAAAAVLIEDATRAPAGRRLAVAFTTDVLDHVRCLDQPLVITREEIRAWRAEREPEVAEHWPPWSGLHSVADVLAQSEQGGARSDWLAVYRTIHGPPAVGPRAAS